MQDEYLAFVLNPNCSGLIMLWILIYLSNLDGKIYASNLPRQLVIKILVKNIVNKWLLNMIFRFLGQQEMSQI